MLLIHVQPDEGLSLAIGAKVPGQGMSIRTVHMDFLYGSAFRDGLPEAYERLILDAMLGDATLFTRADEIEEQWALVDAIVAAWQRDRPAFPNYAGRHVGAALGRRAARIATAAPGGGTDAGNAARPSWSGTRRLDRGDRGGAGATARRLGGRGRASRTSARA